MFKVQDLYEFLKKCNESYTADGEKRAKSEVDRVSKEEKKKEAERKKEAVKKTKELEKAAELSLDVKEQVEINLLLRHLNKQSSLTEAAKKFIKQHESFKPSWQVKNLTLIIESRTEDRFLISVGGSQDLIEAANVLKGIAKQAGKAVAEVEKRWEKLKKKYLSQKDKVESDLEQNDYRYISGMVKRSFGLKPATEAKEDKPEEDTPEEEAPEEGNAKADEIFDELLGMEEGAEVKVNGHSVYREESDAWRVDGRPGLGVVAAVRLIGE